jgi:hypothetical protein
MGRGLALLVLLAHCTLGVTGLEAADGAAVWGAPEPAGVRASDARDPFAAWGLAHAMWCRARGVPVELPPRPWFTGGPNGTVPNGTRIAVWSIGRGDYFVEAGVRVLWQEGGWSTAHGYTPHTCISKGQPPHPLAHSS